MSEYYVGLSISDLQQWLADDTISIFASRVFYSRVHLDEQSAEVDFDGLFKILPSFSLDDQAGVLIVEIAGPSAWGYDDEPGVRNLDLSMVKRFLPLTSDAKKVLTINWSGSIFLEDAIFEKQFLRFRLRRKKAAAIEAGLKLVGLFIGHDDINFDVSEEYKNSLTRALMSAEQLKPDEIDEVLGSDASYKETWVDRIFGYTRHKRIDKAENIKSFYDVGVILSRNGSNESVIDSFRNICERVNRSGELSLADVCSDPELHRFEVDFYISGIDSVKIPVVTLGLFLRWKQRFHDDKSAVNAEAILGDLHNISGRVDAQMVSNALWLMGAYLGMEYVSPIYRLVQRKNYKALVFSGMNSDFFPVPVWTEYKPLSWVDSDLSAVDAGCSEISRGHEDSVFSDTVNKNISENTTAECDNLEAPGEGVKFNSSVKVGLSQSECSMLPNTHEPEEVSARESVSPVGSFDSKEIEDGPVIDTRESSSDTSRKNKAQKAQKNQGHSQSPVEDDKGKKADNKKTGVNEKNQPASNVRSKADNDVLQGEFQLEGNEDI